MSASYKRKNLNDFSYGKEQLKQVSYGKNLIWEKSTIFEFIICMDNSPSLAIEYTGSNKNFKRAYMDYSSNSFNYGSWKNTWLMKAFKPCILSSSGYVTSYLNPDNLLEYSDGRDASSELSSGSGNAMVEIDQIWIKEVQESEYRIHIYLAPYRVDDSYDCWTHYNRNNDLVDHYYHAMYQGSTSGGSTIRSLKGQPTYSGVTNETLRNYCRNNGSRYDCQEWSFRRLLQYCLMLIGQCTDSRTTFGHGYLNELYTPGNVYTGGNEEKGLFWGSNNTSSHVRVFGIEDFWGNISDLINGLCTNGPDYLYLKMTPGSADGSGSDYTDFIDDHSNYHQISRPMGSSSSSSKGGYTNKMKVIPGYGLFPVSFDGSQRSSVFYDYLSFTGEEGATYWFGAGGRQGGIGMFYLDNYEGGFTLDSQNGVHLIYK